MKVKELIEKLQQFDPEMEVRHYNQSFDKPITFVGLVNSSSPIRYYTVWRADKDSVDYIDPLGEYVCISQ